MHDPEPAGGQPRPAWRRLAVRAAPLLGGGAWLALLLAPLLSPAHALATRDVLLFHLPLRVSFRNLVAAGALPIWNPWLNGGQPILSNPSYAAFYPPTWLVLPLPPVYALNVLALLHAALALAGAWRLARHLGAGRAAAALAAVGYTGGGAMLSLLNAFTLFCSMAWFPWVLLLGDRALRRPAGSRWLLPALGCSVMLAMQILNGEPSTVMVSGLGLLALAAAAALDGRRTGRTGATVRGGADAAPAGGAEKCAAPAAIAEVAAAPGAAKVAAGAMAGMPKGRATEAAPAGGPAGWARPLWRVLLPPLAATALAAVQVLPTAGRLAGTIRSHGLDTREATVWSARPERLVELLLPRFFGDAAQHGQGLFFGRGLHDLGFPYVISFYPGLLITLLAAAALCLWPVPRRAAWALCCAGGAFLALGRNNPLYEPARRLLLPLAVQRYPERFAILALLPLAFAAALGWQRLLDERRAGRPQAAELPLALALVTLATAALLTLLLHQAPAVALVFLRDHATLPVTTAKLARGLLFLRREGWAAVATAAAAVALFALCRWRRPPAALLSTLAVALTACDLWHYGHSLVRTVPAATYRDPPPLLRQLAAPGARLYVETMPEERQLPLGRGDADQALARAMLDRLLPYSAALWEVPYALNEDFDRMLTHWGSVTQEVLRADLRQRPEMAFRLLGAWGVSGMIVRASTAAGQPEALPPGEVPATAVTPASVPRRVLRNPYQLATWRFVPRVSFHPSYSSALYIARAQGYAVDRHENCARPGREPATVSYPAPPQVLALQPAAEHVSLHYRAPAGGFFVAAVTYDEGWQASVDGAPHPAYVTALGQIGVELPAGEHRLVLAYHDRLLPLGAAVSLATLALIVALASATSRRPNAPELRRVSPGHGRPATTTSLRRKFRWAARASRPTNA